MHTVTQPSPRRSLTSLYPRRRLLLRNMSAAWIMPAILPSFSLVTASRSNFLHVDVVRSDWIPDRMAILPLLNRASALYKSNFSRSRHGKFFRARNCLIFQGNFRKRKTQTTALFPEEFPETLVKGKDTCTRIQPGQAGTERTGEDRGTGGNHHRCRTSPQSIL